MEIKNVTSAMLSVESTSGEYAMSGVANVLEDGMATSVQNGVVKKDGSQVATFTSWNDRHLNFDCANVEYMTAVLKAIDNFLEEVRATKFEVVASIVE